MHVMFWLLSAWVAVICWMTGVQCRTCPWDEPGLKLWSSKNTWANNNIPANGDQVTIPSGVRVLLDVQPQPLATLTIDKGAALIWGNVTGLILDTHYIMLKGEFHIGSESCPFDKPARIRLHGRTDDVHNITEEDFGRKVIGVAPGGVLELHGKNKTSWTKLAQTVRTAKDVEYGIIYSHSNQSISKERQQGMHVIVWHEDGSLLDFKVFKQNENITEFIPEDTFNGKIVGMFAYGLEGIGKGSANRVLKAAICRLGGSLINQVDKFDSYAFLAKIGEPDNAKEFTQTDGQKVTAPLGFLRLFNKINNVEFQVSTSYEERKDYFRVLHGDMAFPTLTLADKVTDWLPGDEIVLTSTDYQWTQAESRRIVERVSDRRFKVDGAFQFVHFGNFTNYVDERGEVAMLTRYIVIEGMMEDECYSNNAAEKLLCRRFNIDTFGGHMRFARNFNAVHIEGVELVHMGQQSRLGAYPLHFHMCDDAKGMYWRHNTVHHSFSRCLTVHATNHLTVSHNVCYKHLGHGVFIEDGVEQSNRFEGNLVAGTMYGSLLMSDMKREWCGKKWTTNCGNADVSSFWITHPNNEIINNVAAGGEGKGFMFVFADQPLGPSLARQKELGIIHHPKDFPLHFTKNVAHSYSNAGVFMDEKVSTGTGMENKGKVPLNGIIRTESEYDPHVNGTPVWTEMSYGTYYKNCKDNMWIKGGNIRISYSTLADSLQGFSGGTTLFESGTEVYKCIFIGETENKGMGVVRMMSAVASDDKQPYHFDRSYPGQPTNTMSAIGLYQGPNIVKNCFFDKYASKSWCLDNGTSDNCNTSKIVTRHAGAISFKRSNNYPTMTSSYLEGNTFGFCDESDDQHWLFHGDSSLPDWIWKDGNKAVFIRDKDGHITGTPNASIVSDVPLFGGHHCQKRPDWGTLQVCPYRYVKFELLGTTGNLGKALKTESPLIIRRDDAPYNTPYVITGEIRNEYLLRTHRSYIIDFNFDSSKAAFPSDFKLFAYGVQSGDIVRIGICQPKNVNSFDIRMENPYLAQTTNNSWVKSLKELDQDLTGTKFFYDGQILFFKVIGQNMNTNETQRCPEGKCWKMTLNVNAAASDFKNGRQCGGTKIIPAYKATAPKRTPMKPKTQPCPGEATPTGVGSVDWSRWRYVVTNELTLNRPRDVRGKKRGVSIRQGCYANKFNKTLMLEMSDELVLSQSMTRSFCLNRCYSRCFKYAGLSKSNRCTCIGAKPGYGPSKGTECNMKCTGNTNLRVEPCGGQDVTDIWSTGY